MKQFLQYKKNIFGFLWMFLLLNPGVYSQSAGVKSQVSKWNVKPFERKAFIENKGQFDNSLPADKKTFNYCIDKGYQVFFYNNQISYRFTKYVKAKETILSKFESEEKREAKEHEFKTETQFVNVSWLNSNPDAVIEVKDKQTTYYSYVIKSDSSEAKTVMCPGYSKLIYKNLYDGIDVEYVFHPDNGIEYNLLIHAGADVSKVKMQYTGSDKLSNKLSDIHVSTIAGDIIDHAPETYYASTKEKIKSSFSIENNIVSFNLSSYSKDQEIIIDPWTIVPGFTPSKAYDNGVDAAGNIYIYGGSGGTNIVEKYTSSGALIWSLTNGSAAHIGYGDMLVEQSGDFYLAECYDISGAHTYKFSPASTPLWTSTTPGPDFKEHWRLALNCVTGKVIVAGGGTNYTMNIAEIDAATGVLTNINALNAPDDISGLCVDETGKSYTHGGMTNKISFNDVSNIPIGVVSSGYNHSEASTGYNPGQANGYNMMALGGAVFLFTSDGAAIKKWDRNTRVLLGSAVIPGGQQKLGSGILADKCNNLFVGASNGVYRFDFNLVQKEYKATTGAVYDIAYALNSDIVACGDGFLTPLQFGREPCGTNTVLITNNICNPAINVVRVRPSQGVPPFTFYWDDGSIDSVRINLSLGDHIVTVRDGAFCNPAFFTDTVKVGANTKALTIQKSNPLCHGAVNGKITITLVSSQTITTAVWTPSVSNSQPNDSTTIAAGLSAGVYHCHIASSLGCSFDTVVTLTEPPLLLDSLKGRQVKCPGDMNGAAKVFPYGGTSPYTYSWNTSPVQAAQAASGLGTGRHIITITDSNSCVKIDSVSLVSNPKPLVSFTSPAVCFGDTTVFTNTTSITSGTFTSSWLFGNNSDSAAAKNTKYYYPVCNSYTAKLKVTSDSGCIASKTDTVLIHCRPAAAFTVNNLCYGQSAPFNNISTGAAAYGWDFNYNTGIDDTTASPVHFYTAGAYHVKLTASSVYGCTDTVTHSIIVYQKPIAGFTSSNPCLGDAMIFNDTSTIANDTITAWAWNYGDSSPAGTVQNPAHPYSAYGTKTISLIITTTKGCKDTAIQSSIVHPNPTALFSSGNVCKGTVSSFTDNSTLSGTDVIQFWRWNFGDGSPAASSQNTTHPYAAIGSYPVLLKVTSNFGCKDSVTKTITINPNPVVHFSSPDTIGCKPLCTMFQNLSVIASGSNQSWLWNFGDGVTASDPSHCYTNDSIFAVVLYSVTLTVTSDSGCISSEVKNNYITVYPSPKAAFMLDPPSASALITEAVISIDDLSKGAAFWNWDFGNLQTSALEKPAPQNYADTGSYIVKLIVKNQFGCKDSVNHTVRIEPDFVFYLPNAFSPNGDGINDSFAGRGMFIVDFEMMIFDRWGSLIFYTNDLKEGWDGRANHGGEPAQQDVYVYSVKITDIKRKRHTYKGIVTLIK